MQSSFSQLFYHLTFSHPQIEIQQQYQQNILLNDLPSSNELLFRIYQTINSKKNYRENKPYKFSFSLGSGDEIATHNTTTMKCNCKKSKCLKLYCQCFSQGLFCNNCNCICCNNKQQFDDIRAKAIDQVIGRGPLPFGTKKSSSKGCNCKKTSCSKKYCECYGNGEKCNQYCKCSNCSNMTD